MSQQSIGKARGSPACRWCFTLNNWTEMEYGSIESTCRSLAKYAIIGKEVGEKGTPHLQGFVNFRKKLRRSTLKKLSGFTRAHVEIARGTDLENQKYCQKMGVYLEIGIPQRPGKSLALVECLNLLKTNNGDLREAAQSFPEVFVRHGRGLRDYVNTAELCGERHWKTEVIVIVGPPGVGKTKYVCNECEGVKTYWKPRGPWWDGYCGHEYVVLDDFYGWVSYDELLRVCDRYPLRVPIKGSYTQFVAKKLFVTSNRCPEEWYENENIKGSIEALFRRITKYLVVEEGLIKAGSPLYEINY
uniref:Replication-associated protein n=1 Tax=Iberian lynx associated circovirus 1 TaxID=3228841 RepID=A0AAU7VF94_9CIRC